MKRYQELNFFGKLYRWRYYLLLPFISISYKKQGLVVKKYDTQDIKLKYQTANFSSCWRIAKVFIQTKKMIYYYTLEELEQEAKKRIQNDKN